MDGDLNSLGQAETHMLKVIESNEPVQLIVVGIHCFCLAFWGFLWRGPDLLRQEALQHKDFESLASLLAACSMQYRCCMLCPETISAYRLDSINSSCSPDGFLFREHLNACTVSMYLHVEAAVPFTCRGTAAHM